MSKVQTVESTIAEGWEVVNLLRLVNELDTTVRTASAPTIELVRRIVASETMRSKVGANFIAETTERLTELALRTALEKLGIHTYELAYRSPYNHKTPRHGENDEGAEFRLVCGSVVVKLEVEQRTSGFTTQKNYDSEVKGKLSGLERGHGIYVFFNGYEEEELQRVINMGEADGIETISLPPVPYRKLPDRQYLFDLVEYLRWFKANYFALERELVSKLGDLLLTTPNTVAQSELMTISW